MLHQIDTTMKTTTTLKTFKIWIVTEFGTGLIEKKAKDFTEAFRKLCMKDRMKDGWIEDEDGESRTFDFILGIGQ